MAGSLQTVLLFSQATQPDPAASPTQKLHASNLLQAYKFGQFQGDFRTFLMDTDNANFSLVALSEALS